MNLDAQETKCKKNPKPKQNQKAVFKLSHKKKKKKLKPEYFLSNL